MLPAFSHLAVDAQLAFRDSFSELAKGTCCENVHHSESSQVQADVVSCDVNLGLIVDSAGECRNTGLPMPIWDNPAKSGRQLEFCFAFVTFCFLDSATP